MSESRYPYHIPGFGKNDPRQREKLNRTANAVKRREGGETPPRQVFSDPKEKTGEILVVAATWKNFAFQEQPAASETDGVTYSPQAGSALPRRLLVWQQSTPEQNGIYTYRGAKWERTYKLQPDAIRGRTIRALWGRRFGGLSWACVGENIVQPLFPPRFRVDHGSDYAGEIPAGLTEMGSGYVPAAGDIVYLSDQSEEGIYIAASDDWIQIGQPAPRTPDLSDLDGIGYFDSDLYAVLSKETAEAKGCLWVRHQAAVSPSALATEEPA